MPPPSSPYFRYGIALVFVVAALALSLLFQGILHDGFLIFFLSAVMLTGWFGRTGAGLFAVVISMAMAAYFFIPPYRAFAVDIEELPYFLSFLLSATVTSWLGSARRHVEEKQRAHLDELFEQSPEAIMLVNLEDRVLRVNKEFTQIFGYRIDEIEGRPSIDLIVPPNQREEAARDRERLSRGQYLNIETTRRRKDGTDFDASEVSFPVIADGTCIGYYSIFRDISEGRRAQEKLQKAQAELAHLSRITTMGELASSIAHEINQPIGAIATNGDAAVRFLAQDPPDLEGAGDALDCIVRDATRAGQVIGRIRSLLSKNPTPMIHIDINEVIRAVLVLTSHEMKRRNTQAAADLTNGLPPVLGDRVQLQQVILNLIMNSLDAMNTITGRPRELTIKSLRNVDSVAVQVMDSGNGWDVRDSAAIFDAFFTTKKDGIGMGLTISRSIVEAHGGRLWAERRSPYGAIFTFSLPVVSQVK